MILSARDSKFKDIVELSFVERIFFKKQLTLQSQGTIELLKQGCDDFLTELNGQEIAGRAMRWHNEMPNAYPINDSRVAKHFIDNGYSIILDKHLFSTELEAAAKEVATILDFPVKAVDIKISLSGKGSGLGLHFDRWDTLQFHLSGSKSWLFGLDKVIDRPTSAMFWNQEISDEAKSYFSNDERYPDLQDINICEGDSYFLPMGLWHQTKAITNTVSLIIRPKIPAFIDLLEDRELRSRLLNFREWRKRTYGLWKDERLSHEGIAILSEML